MADESSQSKVADEGCAVDDEDVVRLEIAMDDALSVDVPDVDVGSRIMKEKN